jgi:transposase-like protein
MDRHMLEQYLAEALSLEEIGRRMGRHPSTVSYWLQKYGLEAVHRSNHLAKGGIERGVLSELVERGSTIRQMAKDLGVSPTSIRYWLARHDLTSARSAAARASAEEIPLARRVTRACRTHGRTDFILEGRGYYRCAKCRQDRVARWRRQTKLKLVSEFGGRCAICGYDRYPGALEFHHLDPSEKRFGLSARGRTRGMAQLREEASKCILLCSNCHAEVEGGLTRYPNCE